MFYSIFLKSIYDNISFYEFLLEFQFILGGRIHRCIRDGLLRACPVKEKDVTAFQTNLRTVFEFYSRHDDGNSLKEYIEKQRKE